MKKVKGFAGTVLFTAICGIMDSCDAGNINLGVAFILCLMCIGCICLLAKKKSAVSTKYNGQACKLHTQNNHNYCTPKRGGVSSGI